MSHQDARFVCERKGRTRSRNLQRCAPAITVDIHPIVVSLALGFAGAWLR
jgi:hypothetical protein